MLCCTFIINIVPEFAKAYTEARVIVPLCHS